MHEHPFGPMGVVLAFLLALTPQLARGEQPVSEPKSVPSVPLQDTIRLKSGAYFRGTIAEFIPGESVTLVTAEGTS